jgi:putative membrane protein
MNNNQKTIIIVFIIGSVAFFLFGGWGVGSHMWGTGMMYGWGGIGLGMGFFWFIFLIGIFILFSERFQEGTEDRAKAIARERFAKGELSEKEFREIMKKL